MAIANYTTQIKAEKSIMEIQQCLVEHGATKIVIDYIDQQPQQLTFCLEMNGNLVAFSLPANYTGVLKTLNSTSKVPKRLRNKEQAIKVSWRILKDWVRAQMAIVDAQLAEMPEIFLPYAVTENGNTLYSEFSNTGVKLLTQ